MTTVKDIGEQGLLEKLQGFCPPGMIGDDAAVLFTSPEQFLVVTTDVLVDGVHFSDVTTSPEDAGWRAVAANLSDLAAMGAIPMGITIGLALPAEVMVSWVERLYQGITDCLHKYNTVIVGGDIVRSPVTSLAITAFGQVHPQRIIRRCTAQVGDAIVVTGVHGASHAGLQLLLHPELRHNLTDVEQRTLTTAHQRPQPRLDILPILWQIIASYPPSSHLPIAGMDSSDGLADAILQICRASGVGAIIESSQIPLPESFQHWLTPEQALEYALYGGEDFQLVLCLPEVIANQLVTTLGESTAIVGTITTGSQVFLQDKEQKKREKLQIFRGFQHFPH